MTTTMKVRYTVEFDLPSRPRHGADVYRKQIETVLSVFNPSAEVVDEAWFSSEEEDAADREAAAPLQAAAEAGGTPQPEGPPRLFLVR